jgi:hypothetical protein
MLVLLAALALAQEAQPLAAYGITVSGGVTLGNHEAGYVYTLVEGLKRSGSAVVPITTGASAGSVNGFLAAVQGCRAPQDDPTETLFWKSWVPLGIEDGIDEDAATRVSLFTKDSLLTELEALDGIWAEGLDASCDVAVVIPVTRLEPVPVRLNQDLALPRQTFRFVLRVKGNGLGVAPTLSNLVDTRAAVPQLLLPLDGQGEHDLDLARDVMSASAAFPVAFAPINLSYCVADMDGENPAQCDTPTHTARFVDGGMFDNIPLRAAHRMTNSGLFRSEDAPTWDTGVKRWGSVQHIYIDPVIRGYTERIDSLEGDDTLYLLDFMGLLSGGFIAQARSAELYALAEERPDVMENTFVAYNRYPQASGFVANFVGAFEQDFRAFDFYVGMYDALRDLDRLGTPEAIEGLAALEPLLETDAWAPTACLLSWYETGHEDLRAACDGEDLLGFRILTQISLDRVYGECRDQDLTEVDRYGHHHCSLAARGQLPPRLFDSPYIDPAGALRGLDEDPFPHFLRLLGAYGFPLTDLGLPANRSNRAPTAMADALMPAVKAMSKRQSDLASKRLLLTVARQGLAYTFAPPSDPAFGYATTGTLLEVGASVRPSRRVPWLRINTAIQADGLLSLFIEDRESFNLGAAIGPEIDFLASRPAPARPTLALRLGAQGSVADNFGMSGCPVDDAGARDCTHVEVQLVGAISLIELLRLQAEVDWIPGLPSDVLPVDVHLGAGFRF